jgi:hypothetical protein
MPFRRTWKDAVLTSALALAWVPLGCGETPSPAPPTPASTPAVTPDASAKAPKGKGKKFADDDMGIAEKREMRRKAQAAGGTP